MSTNILLQQNIYLNLIFKILSSKIQFNMSTQEIIWPENSNDSECDFDDIDINFNLTTMDNVIPVINEENIQNLSPIQLVCII